ncbi:cytochrome c [bacterium]|nr:cytochrome c [bacterium]
MRNIHLSLAILAATFPGAARVPAQDEVIGKQLCDQTCSVCHGATGQGDGDMADLMKIPATNLTLPKQKNDGDFPILKVIHIIDGRTGLRAHGNPMPVFGATFSAVGSESLDTYGPIIVARGKVMSLALYLESMQK